MHLVLNSVIVMVADVGLEMLLLFVAADAICDKKTEQLQYLQRTRCNVCFGLNNNVQSPA